MSTPQVGTALITQTAPKFTDYIVVKDSWKEKPNTEMQRTDDGDSKVANYTFWNEGVDATCDVVIKTGASPLIKGNVLAELSPGTRSFVVIDCPTSDYGGKPLKQSLQLAYHEGFTPTVND